MSKSSFSSNALSKISVFIMVLSICALFMAGCSGESSTSTSTPPQTQSSTTVATTTKPPAVNTTVSSTTAAPLPTSTAPKPTITTTAPASPAKYGGLVRWIQGTGPGTPIGTPWEAFGASAFNQQHSLEWMFKEQLDGSLTPSLAESWTVDPKAATITFKLRKGVKFHDGTDFNAQAVKWNLEKEMAPGSANVASTTNWKSIEVVDDNTFRVNLKTWQNTALITFSSTAVAQISPTAFEKQGIDALRWQMIGTGPFVQTQFKRDVMLGFEKNKNYWDQGKPFIDKLEIIYLTDLLTCAALLKSGGAEILNCQGSIVTANDVEKAGFKIVTQPAGTGGLGNLTPDSANKDSPWSNVKVRMAAEYALDKDAMARTFGMGYSIPAYQVCASNSQGHDPSLTPRKYDVAKAKQLLAEAGYPNGFKTTIICAPFGLNRDQIIAVQAYFKAVGIQAELTFPAASQAQEYISGTLPTNSLLVNPYMLSANPNRVFTSYFNDPVTSNRSMKRPDGFADLLAATLATPDLDPVLAKKCEAAIYNDCSMIPLAWSMSPFALAANVNDSGIGTRSSLTYWNPENVWLSK
jgi:peptide/nickel transport system substrate-binding protein